MHNDEYCLIGFLNVVFILLPNDSTEVVYLVLNTLLEKVGMLCVCVCVCVCVCACACLFVCVCVLELCNNLVNNISKTIY